MFCFVWHNKPDHWNVLPFGLTTAPRFFTSLTKPILFLWKHKCFHIIIYLDDILVLIHSQHAGRRAQFAHYWFVMDYTLIFPSLKFTFLNVSVFWDFWDTVEMLYL